MGKEPNENEFVIGSPEGKEDRGVTLQYGLGTGRE